MRMRSKQLFLDSLSENFSEKSVNRSEYVRKPHKSHVSHEVFKNRHEKELLSDNINESV